MDLPVSPPVAPMLATLTRAFPEGDYLYEPKWDGFRCVVFKDRDEIELGSRNERSLNRYFPELVEELRAQLPERCVLDGEIVIARDGGLDFEALLQRIHPAASRVRKLSIETPSSFIAFDLLALGSESLMETPQWQRRAALEQALATARPPLHVTPMTEDPELARAWFDRFEGAGLDGVIAKPRALPYVPGRREMLKVKHERTADCVVGGYRAHKNGGIGSLLLGLHDDEGTLHHVGIASGFSVAQRRSLVDELAPLLDDALAGHPWASWRNEAAHEDQRLPGGQSRWSAGRDTDWTPVRPERVVEVAYDHLQGTRFRHATRFRRWRPDREPRSCTYAQLEVATPAELAEVFAASGRDRGR